MRLPSKNPDRSTTILERSKNLFGAIVCNKCLEDLLRNHCRQVTKQCLPRILVSAIVFRSQSIFEIESTHDQVQKQKQIEFQCFSIYQIKKTLGKNNCQHHLTILIAEEPTAKDTRNLNCCWSCS